MNKSTKRIFLLLLLSLSLFKGFSQIVCTPTSGCIPLVGVSFTGLAGASGILWNFSDGGSSNINNPTHTYSSAGTFTVTYTATVAGSPVTQTLIVKCYGKPSPNFSYTIPASHCAPMLVPFTDLSTGAGGVAITNWQWSFGDGGVSASQNPNYTYNIPGTFNVTLIAKDANGCDSTVTKNAIIKVSAKPTMVINSNPLSLSSCTVPFTAAFSGSNCVSGSPIGGALTYNWSFGNGGTSTIMTPPPVTYTASGAYTVSLTCTDNNNCSNSTTALVSLVQPKVKVKIPDTVCYRQYFIVKDTSSATFTSWNWGDGTPSITNIPTDTVMHRYLVSGNFTITVTAFTGGCQQIKTFPIYVQKVTAQFTATPPAFSCMKSMTVSYVNTSVNASTYLWNFPNNSPPGTYTTTATNPTYSITQGSLNPWTIFTMYTPTVQLIAISYFGCRDTVYHAFDSLRRITSYFYVDHFQGCVPLTVKFTDSSFSTSPINYYEWSFGDGSPNVACPTCTVVSHTYTAVGTYTATHIVQNVPGCRDTSFTMSIHVANPPTPSFSFAPSTVCWNQPVIITNTTPPSDSVNHWHFESDGGYFSGCINDPNPQWNFNHTGVFGFTVTAYTHGCKGSAVSTQSVTVKGPIARGRYFTRCDSSYKVKFTANLEDATSGVWNYGDGTTFTLVGTGSFTTSHTYTASGNYTAILTGFNSGTGCTPFKDTLIVTVRKLKAQFTNNAFGCNAIPSIYNAALSQDVMVGCGIGYSWFFDNNPPVVTFSTSTTYTLPPGIHNIMLVVRDTNNCMDTARSIIKISNVIAGISTTSTVGCLPSFNLAFTNTSTSDTTMTYVWTFGDPLSGALNTSTLTSPVHNYTTATPPSQLFSILLTVTNANGCIDTIRKTIQVNAPQPLINSTPSPSICIGTVLNFNANNVFNVVNYQWNFGDGGGAQNFTINPVPHTYTTSGAYSVSLTTTDNAGCKGSTSLMAYVQDYPKAGFNFINQCNITASVACAGCTIIFQDTSINFFPGPRNWDLSTGGPIVPSGTVGTTYINPGNYPITLTVTSSFGCASIARDTIHVYGAKAHDTLSANIVCKGDPIVFTIKDTLNVFTWSWDFGDGSSGGQVSPATHSYTFHPPGNTTFATLIYWTTGMACKYSVVKPITIRDIISDFDRNGEGLWPPKITSDTLHCLGIKDVFTNTSINATSWNWNFGDGSSSTVLNPNHTYASVGTYTITLAISDTQYGCKDTLRKVIKIVPAPSATAAAQNVCLGQPSQLTVIGSPGCTYTWVPSTNLSCTVCSNPVANVTATTLYTINVTNPNGCTSSITQLLYVQQPPPPINWDTSVVIGQFVNVPGNAGIGFTYTWSPITALSCNSCAVPTSTTLVDIKYFLTVEDTMGCFKVTNSYSIHIEPKASVDVPTAFTPNGDGVNDIIYVDGWGIKKLNYFRVLNRWGQILFESNDIKIGWDGTYLSVPQNMETYVYQVSVETYVDAAPILKAGTFKLLR